MQKLMEFKVQLLLKAQESVLQEQKQEEYELEMPIDLVRKSVWPHESLRSSYPYTKTLAFSG